MEKDLNVVPAKIAMLNALSSLSRVRAEFQRSSLTLRGSRQATAFLQTYIGSLSTRTSQMLWL